MKEFLRATLIVLTFAPVISFTSQAGPPKTSGEEQHENPVLDLRRPIISEQLGVLVLKQEDGFEVPYFHDNTTGKEFAIRTCDERCKKAVDSCKDGTSCRISISKERIKGDQVTVVRSFHEVSTEPKKGYWRIKLPDDVIKLAEKYSTVCFSDGLMFGYYAGRLPASLGPVICVNSLAITHTVVPGTLLISFENPKKGFESTHDAHITWLDSDKDKNIDPVSSFGLGVQPGQISEKTIRSVFYQNAVELENGDPDALIAKMNGKKR